MYNVEEKQTIASRISASATEKVGGRVAMTSEYHHIALVGFTPAEFGTFETFFRLVSSRRTKPFKATNQIANAGLVMLCTNDTAEIDRVVSSLSAMQRLVTVGTRRVANAWRHLDRPINLNAVLVTVDAALSDGASTQSTTQNAMPAVPPREATPGPIDASKPREFAQVISPKSASLASAPTLANTVPPQPVKPSLMPPKSESSAPRNVSAVSAAVPSLRAATPSSAASIAPRADNVTPFPNPVAQPSFRAPAKPDSKTSTASVSAPVAVGAARVNILVVDDSDVALKFIHTRLSAFGFTVDKCTSGEEALVRVADGDYQFVFLDVMMEGLDGYQTCKAIKGRRYAGGKPPVVVMLTSRGGTIDKVRGTFAGCDAYLTKPLDETKMLKVLLKHDADVGNAISTLANPATTTSMPRVASDKPNPLAAAFMNLNDRSQ
jgi:CheY-like chemotaxis protein